MRVIHAASGSNIHIHIHLAAATASFMNTVILSSVISAGNHALFAGTRVLYGLAQASQAPSLFAWTTRGGVPLPALLLTSSLSALCFGSSFIGSGQLWAWLQNLVGVSNQVRSPRSAFTMQCVAADTRFVCRLPRGFCRSHGYRSGLRRGVSVLRGRRKAARSRR